MSCLICGCWICFGIQSSFQVSCQWVGAIWSGVRTHWKLWCSKHSGRTCIMWDWKALLYCKGMFFFDGYKLQKYRVDQCFVSNFLHVNYVIDCDVWNVLTWHFMHLKSLAASIDNKIWSVCSGSAEMDKNTKRIEPFMNGILLCILSRLSLVV